MKQRHIIIFACCIIFANSCNFNKSNGDEADPTSLEQSQIPLTYSVSPQDNSFAISFPGQPDFTTESVETEAGIVQNNMYVYEHEDLIAYMISYTDYQIENIQDLDSQELLTNAKTGFVSEIGMKVLFSEEISINKFPGLEFTASGEGYGAHMRDYLVKNRLYQIGLLSADGSVNKEDADAFFNTFELQ